MKQSHFLTIGDHAYFHTIYYAAQNIRTLYPGSCFYIYDWGFTAPQLKKFNENPHVKVIPWEKRLVDISIHFSSWRQMLRFGHGIENLRDFFSYFAHFGRILNDQTYASFLKREILFANKPLCMLDYLKHHGENFIFLDGDAVLMQRIDELLEDSFDIGVTLRELGETSFHPGGCSMLNVGVLFFLGGREKNTLFMEHWIGRMKETHERFIEQSAITHLLYDADSQIFFEHRQTSLSIGGEEIKMKVLPCRNYNHYRSRKYGVNSENKIVHFKSENYKKGVFYDYLKYLGITPPSEVLAMRKEDL